MYLENLLKLISGKKPDDLVPAKLHFRAYFGQPRNPEIWFLIYDLVYHYKMRPMAMIRYLIVAEHSKIFGAADYSQSSELIDKKGLQNEQ